MEEVKSMREILEKEEHIVEIIPGENWEFHDIDYSSFEVDDYFLEILQDFLKGPYIVDDFDNHRERMKWRKEMESKYKEFADYYRTNSLKYQSVIKITDSDGSVLNYLFKEPYTGEEKENMESLKNKITDLYISLNEYDALGSIEKKIEYVKTLKERAYEFLEFLSV